VIPALAFVFFFLIYPTFRTVQLSFDTGEGFVAEHPVGFANYTRMFTDDRAFFDPSEGSGAVFNTLRWLLLYVPGTVGLGLMLAVLANSVRYEVLIKTIVFIPMGISFTAAGIIWRFVYSPDPSTGVLNAILVNVFHVEPVAWLGRSDLVNFALIITAIWTQTGFAMVGYSAALKGLPGEVLEAALVDGATAWRRFWAIIAPMLWPTTVVLLTTAIIGVLKTFDLVYIMTEGGPRTVSRIIGFTMYWETFRAGRPGYGAAVAVVMLIVILPFVYFNIRRFQAEG